MVIDQCNSRQCTQFILPTFDNWREWLILLQSTRMVDSDICIDKIGWFYPNRESTFWTMHAILELHIPILAMRNNKMGHRINKMWTLINKVGHRNVKLVDTYQQVWFKKQQNGSRVLYLWSDGHMAINGRMGHIWPYGHRTICKKMWASEVSLERAIKM